MPWWSVISVTWHSNRWDTCESTKSPIKRTHLSAERWEKLPFNAAEEQKVVFQRWWYMFGKKTWDTKGEFRSAWVRLQKLCWKSNSDSNRAALDQYCDRNDVQNWTGTILAAFCGSTVGFCNGGGAPTGNLPMFGGTVIVFSQLKWNKGSLINPSALLAEVGGREWWWWRNKSI